ELIPRGCNEQLWNDTSGWTLSDHRAVLSTFQYKRNIDTKMDF
ncbi:unnamed protein product, partial [Rotaria socialis]